MLNIKQIAIAIDPFLGLRSLAPWGCESVMSESPSAGGLKKGSIARAQEGINSKDNIIDV